MEVMVPMIPAQDFQFQSASTSPYVSPPSSPKPFGNPSDYYFYASAPASPSRTAAIYARIFEWEDQSSKPKPSGDDAEEFDFAFGFDRQFQRKTPTTNLTAADELFEKGRIRPLMKSPPNLHHPVEDDGSSSATPSSSLEEGGSKPPSREVIEEGVKDRGRTLSTLSTTYSRSRRGPRSLSPIRGAGDFHDSLASSTTPTVTNSLTKGGGSKRWRLKDLLLFRSASEGRVTGRGSKDPLRKFTMLSLLPSLYKKRRSGGEDAKNSSSENGSIRRGSGPALSAHEKHYTMNRAASEESKKKTPLPFHRHGLFGNLSFNPAVHSITRGFSSNSLSRGRS